MSVRRLAEAHLQPATFAFTEENAAWAQKRIAMYPEGRQQSAVIPLLMRAQDQDGWVSRATIETIADMLGMPYIRVLEVATFYTQFQLAPVGSRAHIQVCGTTPCMLRGAEDIRAVCQKLIHPEPHHLNDNGTMSWEEVECAGACVNAPMVTIGHDTYEDLTVERFEEIVVAFAEGRGDEIAPGPQSGRNSAAPIGGRVTLLEEPQPSWREPEPAAPADPVAPTAPGRKREVTEEAAPAIEGPNDAIKVDPDLAEAEAERAKGPLTGEPSQAGREGATGPESPAIDKVAETTGSAPRPLFEAPDAAPDDLKLITGVGSVLEAKLNALGVTTFAQVASFSDADVARLDEALNFRGRVTRDNWIGQAKALADGGIAEYRRVFGRDPR